MFDDVYAELPWHLREQRERARRQPSAMTQMNMVQAINDALRHEMRRDDRVVVLGEDVGKVGGVFRVTAGSLGRVRRRPRRRHAAQRGRHHRHRHRHGALRPAARARDPVRGLHLPGVRPDRQRAGEAALALGRGVPGQDGPAHARRRRHPRGPLPLAVARIALHPRGGAQGRLPVQPARREGPAPRVDARSGPRPLLRAQAHLPRRQGRGARGRLHGAPRQGRRRARGQRTSRSSRGAPCSTRPSPRPTRRRSRASSCEIARPSHALAGRHRHHRREREEDRARRRRPRGARRRAASGPSSSRCSTSRRSCTSRRRPARVCGLDTPFPYTLEMEYLPLAHRILPAHRRRRRSTRRRPRRPRWRAGNSSFRTSAKGVTEGEIVGWLVKPGDVVDEDQPMVEVMTDKATVTITAPQGGHGGGDARQGRRDRRRALGARGVRARRRRSQPSRPRAATRPWPRRHNGTPEGRRPGGDRGGRHQGDAAGHERARERRARAAAASAGGAGRRTTSTRSRSRRRPRASSPATSTSTCGSVPPSGPARARHQERTSRRSRGGRAPRRAHAPAPDALARAAPALTPTPPCASPQGAARGARAVRRRAPQDRAEDGAVEADGGALHLRRRVRRRRRSRRCARASRPPAEEQGVKLSFLPFIVKAVVRGAQEAPDAQHGARRVDATSSSSASTSTSASRPRRTRA